MFTEIHQPNKLSPDELDEYLRKGWFRMGQMIFTCQFLCFNDQLYSAVWIRLSLKGHTYGKRARKLIRRNQKKFRALVRPSVFDEEKEELYRMHNTRFQGYIAKSLRESLFGDVQFNIYNTFEVCIYEGEKLVAVSFFDIGSKSIASIMGLFLPEYGKYSLGYYTMLVEMEFGIQNDLTYYYPGYVVPGYGRFDYKLKIGAVDYFDWEENNWLPYDRISLDQQPAELMLAALQKIQTKLKELGVYSRRALYPLYDKRLFGLDASESVLNPAFLVCSDRQDAHNLLILEYDIRRKHYILSEVFRLDDATMLINKAFAHYDREKCILNFLIRERELARSPRIHKMIHAILMAKAERLD